MFPIFKQKRCTALGTKFATIYSTLFMLDLEQRLKVVLKKKINNIHPKNKVHRRSVLKLS